MDNHVSKIGFTQTLLQHQKACLNLTTEINSNYCVVKQ